MSILFIDIETLPTNNQFLITDLEKTIKAPATHKKQESIDAWFVENKEKALNELISKTSFDGAYGSIACISFSLNTDDEISYFSTEIASEKNMLIAFFGFIERNNVTQFCGHNILGFDLPFIKHRSIINNVKPPAVLVDAFNAKQWSGNVLDTMLMWSQDKQKMISLDKLCRILGIECEIDFDGSMVANEWINGDKQKVIDYCMQDVDITRQAYKRLSFQSDVT